MYRISNAPAPDELLLTAREALKSVLKDSDADHTYTLLMVMNAMGIAARALNAGEPAACHPEISDEELKAWAREANPDAVTDAGLIRILQRHLEQDLAVCNPRFEVDTGPSDATG